MSTTVNNNFPCSGASSQVPEALLATMQLLDALSDLSQRTAKSDTNDAGARPARACSAAPETGPQGYALNEEDDRDDETARQGDKAFSCPGSTSSSPVGQATENPGTVGNSKASGRNPLTRQAIDRTPDPDWKGDRAEGVGALSISVEEFKVQMYAQVDQELDAVLGKGQYDKPQNHYQYVQRVAEAMKLLDPEQQKAMKNRLEQIGQPLHTNFGLTRTRNDNGYMYGVALNSYAVNGFSGAQSVEKKQLKAEFYRQRDEALGRN
jgi:hypothetical protein